MANLAIAEIEVPREILTSLMVKSEHEVVTGEDLGGKEIEYFVYPFKGSYSTK